MAKSRFVKGNRIVVVVGLRVLPRLLRRELCRAFVSPKIELKIEIGLVPVRIFGRGDQMLHIVRIASVIEVHSRESCSWLTTIASFVLPRLRFLRQILIFSSAWLEAAHRLKHLLMLLAWFTGSLEFVLPLLHVFIVEARWNHLGLVCSLVFIFVVGVAFDVNVVAFGVFRTFSVASWLGIQVRV